MEVRVKVSTYDQPWEQWTVKEFFMETNEAEHAFALMLARKISEQHVNVIVTVELD